MSPLKEVPAKGGKRAAKAKPLAGKGKTAESGVTAGVVAEAVKTRKPRKKVLVVPQVVEPAAKKAKQKTKTRAKAIAKPVDVFDPMAVAAAPKKPRKTAAAKAAPPAQEEPSAPREYEERLCGIVYLMARSGKDEDEIAAALGIDVETMALWRIEHWKFDNAFTQHGYGMGGGRPTAYKPEYAAKATLLASLGATDLEISQFFDVSLRTIHRWKVDQPEFREALTMGKEEADKKVEESLYRRAVGYTFDSEKVLVVDKEIQRIETVEHVPPDTKAAMFWLQNRRPGIWRDTKHLKHDVEEDSPLGKFLDEVSGHAFKPKDQEGPASSSADDEGSTAFAPREDEQGNPDATL
tara:strand:- start:7379 stop:8431 length:1053 start_codon:yes stop_codon:yes gene_type:complete